jgi:hypothetical protein
MSGAGASLILTPLKVPRGFIQFFSARKGISDKPMLA